MRSTVTDLPPPTGKRYKTEEQRRNKVEEEITYIAVTHMTTEALAERLRKMIYDPRGWSKVEKEITWNEAARRLDLLEIFREWLHSAMTIYKKSKMTKQDRQDLIDVVRVSLTMIRDQINNPQLGVEVLEEYRELTDNEEAAEERTWD